MRVFFYCFERGEPTLSESVIKTCGDMPGEVR